MRGVVTPPTILLGLRCRIAPMAATRRGRFFTRSDTLLGGISIRGVTFRGQFVGRHPWRGLPTSTITASSWETDTIIGRALLRVDNSHFQRENGRTLG